MTTSIDNGRSRVTYRRGYRAPRELREFIGDAHKTNLSRTLVAASLDIAAAVAAVSGASWITAESLIVGMPVMLVAVVIAARQLESIGVPGPRGVALQLEPYPSQGQRHARHAHRRPAHWSMDQ